MLREAMPEIVTECVPGPKAQEILKRRNEAVPKALCGSTYPICMGRGEGAILEDVDGNRFLDWVGGVGVLNIGYSEPSVVEAVREQAGKYFHGIFNVYVHEGYVKLAEMFDETVPCKGENKKTYFANSGAEANENAIKIAKAYTGRDHIICFSGAFHGRTNLTMALTAKKSYALGMGPFPSGIYRAEFPYLYRAPKGYTEEEAIQYYIDDLKKIFINGAPANDIAAIIIEPVEGEGGFVPVPLAYVKELRKICDENGILLIADEVQCGNCRTGRYFASEYWKEAGAAPDIVSTAKSMGAGTPISAITARAEIMDAAPAGTIGGTYCGNPLACAAAVQTMEVMKREDYCGKAEHIGNYMRNELERMQEKYEVIGDVRGLGAMLGIEFVEDKKSRKPNPELVGELIREGLQKGLLMENAGTYGNVIRFLAPLCMTDDQMKAGLSIFEDVLSGLCGM